MTRSTTTIWSIRWWRTARLGWPRPGRRLRCSRPKRARSSSCKDGAWRAFTPDRRGLARGVHCLETRTLTRRQRSMPDMVADRPRLLLAEDDPSLAAMMRESLEDDFR